MGEGRGRWRGGGLLLHHHHQIGIKTVCGTGKTLALEGKGPRITDFPQNKLLFATFLFLRGKRNGSHRGRHVRPPSESCSVIRGLFDMKLAVRVGFSCTPIRDRRRSQDLIPDQHVLTCSCAHAHDLVVSRERPAPISNRRTRKPHPCRTFDVK